jgi:hypothetical protein
MLLGCTLALAACNSSSVSGTQSKTSTNAETKATTKSEMASRPQGLIGAALSKAQQ